MGGLHTAALASCLQTPVSGREPDIAEGFYGQPLCNRTVKEGRSPSFPDFVGLRSRAYASTKSAYSWWHGCPEASSNENKRLDDLLSGKDEQSKKRIRVLCMMSRDGTFKLGESRS